LFHYFIPEKKLFGIVIIVVIIIFIIILTDRFLVCLPLILKSIVRVCLNVSILSRADNLCLILSSYIIIAVNYLCHINTVFVTWLKNIPSFLCTTVLDIPFMYYYCTWHLCKPGVFCD